MVEIIDIIGVPFSIKKITDIFFILPLVTFLILSYFGIAIDLWLIICCVLDLATVIAYLSNMRLISNSDKTMLEHEAKKLEKLSLRTKNNLNYPYVLFFGLALLTFFGFYVYGLFISFQNISLNFYIKLLFVTNVFVGILYTMNLLFIFLFKKSYSKLIMKYSSRIN